MKNLKKFLAVLVVVAMLATLMVPAFAAEEISADAKICADLGILKGSNGVDAEYLAKSTTRIQAAILTLRLMGKEDEALAYDGEENFKDVDKMTWADGKNVMAYLKDNPDLGWRGWLDELNPYGQATAAQVTKVLLEALGYKQDVDFEWEEVMTFAESKGLVALKDVDSVTNDDMASALVEALLTETKDGETLVAVLVENGIITEEAANASGLLGYTFTAAVATTKSIKVTFNKAVDTTKASLALKNGNIIIATSIAWNEAKTEATLSATIPFAAGNYSVVVSGLGIEDGKDAANLTIAPERIESIAIETLAYRTGVANQVTVGYKIFNQYTEDITANVDVTKLVATSSKGETGGQPSAKGVITVSTLGATDTSFDVTIVDRGFAKTARATVTITDAKGVAEVVLGTPEIKTGKTKLEANVADYVMPYTAKDQYGNSATVTDLSKLTFVSSDTSVVDPASAFGLDSGKLTVDFGTFAGAKTVTVTVIVNATGKSSQVTFTVYGTATADAPALVAPTTRFGKGEAAYKVQLTIKDLYGNDMAAADIKALYDASGLTVTSGNLGKFTVNEVVAENSKAYVSLKGIEIGSANLTVTVNATGKTTTLGLTVVEAKYPASITLSPNFTYAVKGAKIVLKATFKDQYGDAITSSNNKVTFAADKADFAAAPGDSTVTTMHETGVEITAADFNKASTYTVKLYDTAGTSVIHQASVTLTSVKADASLTYKVADLGTVAAASASDTAYEKAVTIYAEDASANKIALVGDELQTLVSGDLKLNATALGQKKIKAANASDDGVANFSALVNTNTGLKTIAGSVTISKVAPVAEKIEAKTGSAVVTKATLAAGAINFFTSANLKFVVTDQYGTTAMSNKNSVSVFVQDTADNSVTRVVDAEAYTFAAGSYKVTAVTFNGLTATVEVTVN